MNIKNTNQINFKGYSNILSHTIQDKNGDSYSVMAMKLNNIGPKDLNSWELLQRAALNQSQSDYIIFSSISKNGKNYVTLGEKVLDINKSKSSCERKVIQMCLNYLEFLTRRIETAATHKENGDLYLTLVELSNYLSKINNDKSFVENLCWNAAAKKTSHNRSAGLINKHVKQALLKCTKL